MKQIAFLSGAGVSKESGISTFRDSDGLWENYPVEKVASIDGWYENPKLVLDFYNQRRKELQSCKPNKAHQIIAELEKDFKVWTITQNVDNLHEKAGSTNIIHLHGELTKAHAENDEAHPFDIGYNDINIGDVNEKGIQIRPHIVWFGEAVPMIEKAAEIISKSDILVVIGTSLNVYPAAGLIRYIKSGTPIVLVDPNNISLNYAHYTQITDVATKGMEKLKKILLEQYK